MILASLLTILIDGSPLAMSQPPRIVAGRIMAPLVPVMTRIADAISVRGDRTIVFDRGRREVSVLLALRTPCPECDVYVPLAAVVRGLGGAVRYDPHAGSVELSFSPPELRTPAPYDMLAPPHPAATTLTWPSAPSPTPRPVVVGTPQPRRTPVEVRIPGL